MKKSHFRYWELVLLLALAVTILWGAASLGQQEELGRKVIRLHVIANHTGYAGIGNNQALWLILLQRIVKAGFQAFRAAKNRMLFLKLAG